MMRLVMVGLLAFWTSGCEAAVSPGEPVAVAAAVEEAGAAAFEPQTAVYRCTTGKGEIRLVTRTRENGIHVFLPPDLDEVYLDCEHDRRESIWEHAKLSGVDFRAVGNEPGWVLEIREAESLKLSYDYGQSEIVAGIDDRRTDTDRRTTLYFGSEGERRIEVRLTGESCADTMADEVYPTRVEVLFDDRRLMGCGRPLH